MLKIQKIILLYRLKYISINQDEIYMVYYGYIPFKLKFSTIQV